jgi:RNA polymerase sigma factor (sigma-70 family)
MTEPEKTLIAGCVSGDKAAWDAFVLQYSGLIYHTIRKTAALHRAETSQDFADDLFQEIFLSLIKDHFLQLRRFRGDHGCTLASWLRMIAARRTIDQLRKLSKTVNPLEESLIHKAADESEREVDEDQLQLLDNAIAELQPRERIILDLFFRQNLSAQDVASILQLSVGAVYTQKSRILAKLRETLGKSGSL